MDRYEELKLIGKGNFGSCYLVRDKGSGARVVVKKVAMTTLSAKERADSEMECQLLMPVWPHGARSLSQARWTKCAREPRKG